MAVAVKGKAIQFYDRVDIRVHWVKSWADIVEPSSWSPSIISACLIIDLQQIGHRPDWIYYVIHEPASRIKQIVLTHSRYNKRETKLLHLLSSRLSLLCILEAADIISDWTGSVTQGFNQFWQLPLCWYLKTARAYSVLPERNLFVPAAFLSCHIELRQKKHSSVF